MTMQGANRKTSLIEDVLVTAVNIATLGLLSCSREEDREFPETDSAVHETSDTYETTGEAIEITHEVNNPDEADTAEQHEVQETNQPDTYAESETEKPPLDKVLYGTSNYAPNTLIISENSFLITGNYTPSLRDAFARKCDYEGNVIWGEKYGSDKWDNLSGATKAYNNGYILAGDRNNPETDDRDIWVFKINKDGAVLWETFFGTDKTDHGQAICRASLNEYFVASRENLYVVNDEGELLETTPLPSDIRINKMMKLSDDNYLLAGRANSDIDKSIVAKVNENGSLLWEQQFIGDFGSGANSAAQLVGGAIVLIGTVDYDKTIEGYDNGWMIMLNLNGDILDEQIFVTKHIDQIYSVTATSNGGFVTAGARFMIGEEYGLYTNFDPWIMTFDSEGNLLTEFDKGLEFKNDQTLLVGETPAGALLFIGKKKNNLWIFEKTNISSEY